MSTASARMQTAYQLGQPVGRHRTDTRNTASGLQCNSINDSAAVMVNGTRVREGGVPGLLASQGVARMVEGVVWFKSCARQYALPVWLLAFHACSAIASGAIARERF